jgi:cyclin-dependent kinase 12/13
MNIDYVQMIGAGTFGTVYKGVYTDKEGVKHQIAIKKFKQIEKDGDYKGLPIPTYREIKYLQLVDHENIVKLRDIKYSRPSKSQSN